jgi:hypothetical protein
MYQSPAHVTFLAKQLPPTTGMIDPIEVPAIYLLTIVLFVKVGQFAYFR